MLLTVVIPTHNRIGSVRSAIDSVLLSASARPDVEIFVVDDGSTDGTAEALEKEYGSSIQLLCINQSGAASARNQGAALARGRWLAFLDSDDRLDEEWVQLMLAATTSDPSVSIAFCAHRERWPDGRVNERPLTPLLGYPDIRGRFLAGTYVVARDFFLATGGYWEELPSVQHTELGLRFMANLSPVMKVATVDQPLMTYHRASADGVRRNWSGIYEATTMVLERHRELFNTLPREAAEYLDTAGVAAIRAGLVQEGRRMFIEAASTQLSLRRAGRLALATVPPIARRFWRVG